MATWIPVEAARLERGAGGLPVSADRRPAARSVDGSVSRVRELCDDAPEVLMHVGHPEGAMRTDRVHRQGAGQAASIPGRRGSVHARGSVRPDGVPDTLSSPGSAGR